MKAYTIGVTEGYDDSLKKPEGCVKIGFRAAGAYDMPLGHGPYKGGWVWRTIPEASRFLRSDFWVDEKPEKYSVYELDIPDWETAVSEEPDFGDVHNLLVDSPIVRKIYSPHEYRHLCEEHGRLISLMYSRRPVALTAEEEKELCIIRTKLDEIDMRLMGNFEAPEQPCRCGKGCLPSPEPSV